MDSEITDLVVVIGKVQFKYSLLKAFNEILAYSFQKWLRY